MPSIASRMCSTGCSSKSMLAHEEIWRSTYHILRFPLSWTLPELTPVAGLHVLNLGIERLSHLGTGPLRRLGHVTKNTSLPTVARARPRPCWLHRWAPTI